VLGQSAISKLRQLHNRNRLAIIPKHRTAARAPALYCTLAFFFDFLLCATFLLGTSYKNKAWNTDFCAYSLTAIHIYRQGLQLFCTFDLAYVLICPKTLQYRPVLGRKWLEWRVFEKAKK